MQTKGTFFKICPFCGFRSGGVHGNAVKSNCAVCNGQHYTNTQQKNLYNSKKIKIIKNKNYFNY